MFSFFPKSNVFGLDIGFETLKLVELKKEQGNIFLRGAISSPLTDRIIEKDHFKDKASVAKMIKEACERAKPEPIKATGIVSALPETFVFSKTIQVPKMPESDYTTLLPQEVAQYLPLPVEEVYIDYQTLIVHPDEPLVDVLFVAAPKRLVDEYVEVVEMAGYKLDALETKPLAVGRALLTKNSTDGTMIAEVGTEICRISIWDGNKIRLTTTVGIGKNQLKDVLGDSGTSGKSLDDTTISVYAKELISPLVEEMSEAIRYHQNRDYQPKPIKHVLICGSGARVPGLDGYIKSRLKLETILVKPKLSGSDTLESEFTTAFGLALWEE